MENFSFNILDEIEDRKKLTIKRPVYTEKELEDEFLVKEEAIKRSDTRSLFKCLDLRQLLNLFTFFNLISEYDFKNDLIPDIMSGFTVGIVHIPQVNLLFN